MAQEFSNINRGSVWRNEKKEADTHPDFTGSINIEGVEYWLSGWKRKEGANPKSPALSLSFKRKDVQQKAAPNAEPKGDFDDFEDDIPF
jgi:hypothetical protein